LLNVQRKFIRERYKGNNNMEKVKSSLRIKADKIKDFRCKNLIAVIEEPDDLRNVGTIIRNVNALGVEKAYVVSKGGLIPEEWELMRTKTKLNALSASAIKWSFVKVFKTSEECFDHLEQNGFISAVTSPHTKGKENAILHEHDFTEYKKLAVWFGNEGVGISKTAFERSQLCINIPMYGIIESFNLGTSSGIVLYEITKQRREFQFNLKKIKASKVEELEL
jgi:tRNA (guanosine-2'-O-)-methyltransferase